MFFEGLKAILKVGIATAINPALGAAALFMETAKLTAEAVGGEEASSGIKTVDKIMNATDALDSDDD